MNINESYKYKFESSKYLQECNRISYQAGVRGLSVYRVFPSTYEGMEPYLQRSLLVMVYSMKYRVLLDQPVFAGMIWPKIYDPVMEVLETTTLESLGARVLAVIEGEGVDMSFSDYVPPIVPLVMTQDSGMVMMEPHISEEQAQELLSECLVEGQLVVFPEDRKCESSLPSITSEVFPSEEEEGGAVTHIVVAASVTVTRPSTVFIPFPMIFRSCRRFLGDYQVQARLVIETNAFRIRGKYVPNKVDYLVRGGAPFACALEPSKYSVMMYVEVRSSCRLAWTPIKEGSESADVSWRFFLNQMFLQVREKIARLRNLYGSTFHILYFSSLIRDSVFPFRMPMMENLCHLLFIGEGKSSIVGWRVCDVPFISWVPALQQAHQEGCLMRGLLPNWSIIPSAEPYMYNYYCTGTGVGKTFEEMEEADREEMREMQERTVALSLEEELEGIYQEEFDEEDEEVAAVIEQVERGDYYHDYSDIYELVESGDPLPREEEEDGDDELSGPGDPEDRVEDQT